MNPVITGIKAIDIRFPTSRHLDGSDAMNKDPDYSAAYVIIETSNPDISGHGLTFTIGRGNDVCVAAIKAMSHLLVGKSLSDLTTHMGQTWRDLTGDSQLRWLGPDKGVMHLATGAVVNAIWDMWGKAAGKPVWQLVAEMTPEQFVDCVDFRYLTNAITRDDALEILRAAEPGKQARMDEMRQQGYPAYTTSAGWLGYSDEKLRRLCQEAIDAGWDYIKLKVGLDVEDDKRRLAITRDVIGPNRKLMVDANQNWEVDQAISWMKELAEFDPWFIEEPTSPDDILGHKQIREGISPIRVATGEHCQNRIIFKQFLQADAIDVVQIDSCRVGGVNEIMAILLMAKKFNKPVCPHAGGVGLCEYVQHLSMIDYICVSASLEDRVLEYVDHLHEHFETPCVIRNGRYIAPTTPGFSITMKPQSIIDHTFPTGIVWQENK
ncbi:L-fuconate dehydratase [uncultured Thalassospira sp.]|uniref:L-fuconate dehydratase n=1 Tax=uncultured Thalassospira sp. TaxID=404382 RepID=UPI0030DB9944|tara:strand:+ start:1333 stop:2637 length:1305 start_codon:yes stop_codon:yes gene_type:complete